MRFQNPFPLGLLHAPSAKAVRGSASLNKESIIFQCFHLISLHSSLTLSQYVDLGTFLGLLGPFARSQALHNQDITTPTCNSGRRRYHKELG